MTEEEEKPIARIYWLEEGQEKSLPVHTQQSLDGLTRGMKRENVCYWVCMESMDVAIPRNAS